MNRWPADLRERVLALPDPRPVQMFDHVYPLGSPEVDEQGERYAAYAASFVEEAEGAVEGGER